MYRVCGLSQLSRKQGRGESRGSPKGWFGWSLNHFRSEIAEVNGCSWRRRAGWFRESFLRCLVRAYQGSLAAIRLNRNPSWRTRNQAWEKGVSDGVWQSRCPVVCQEAAQERGVSAAWRGTGTKGPPDTAPVGCRRTVESGRSDDDWHEWTSDPRWAASVHRRFVRIQ